MWFSQYPEATQKLQKIFLFPFDNVPVLLLLLYPPFMPDTRYGMCSGRWTRPGMGCGCLYCAMSALFSHLTFSAAEQSAGSHVLDKNGLLAKTHSPVS